MDGFAVVVLTLGIVKSFGLCVYGNAVVILGVVASVFMYFILYVCGLAVVVVEVVVVGLKCFI